jgi:hypothetical protein
VNSTKNEETGKEQGMSGKYTPLERYLCDLPASQREVTLSFEQIEGILNDKLPSSAYEDRRWWDHETEGNHVNARAWANAGWKIESLDVKGKWVKLVRAATNGGAYKGEL